MRNRFDEQLEELNTQLIEMGALAEHAIQSAAQALLHQDVAEARQAKRVDSEIDEKERTIESICMKLLLHQQPVAKDLRVISAAMKMIYDLQRIGDQAYDIADISRYVQDTELMHRLPMQQLADAAVAMVTDSVDAFVRMDFALAKHVIAADDTVDEYFSRMKEELAKVLRQDGDSSVCLDILMISKYLERIADHAVNIADWVIFAQTGAHSGKE